MTVKQRMMDLLPGYYQDEFMTDSLVGAQAAEVDTLLAAINEVLDQFFIDYATWGVAFWEKLCSITPDDTKPLDQRIAKVKSRIRTSGVATVELIKSIAESFNNGQVDITDYTKNLLVPMDNVAWVKHANATVDATNKYKFTLNAVSPYFQTSYVDVLCVPNTVYTISALMSPSTARVYIDGYDANNVKIGNLVSTGDVPVVFTTQANAVKLRVSFGDNGSAGTFVFQDLMLQLGNTLSTIAGPATTNFVNKVSASIKENANIMKRNNGQSSLQVPTGTWSENSDTQYGRGTALDGQVVSTTVSPQASGDYAQQLFSFDLIQLIDRKYGVGTVPGVTIADKVAWLKLHVTSILCNWYGYGTGPNGNKAYCSMWSVTGGAWNNVNTTTNGSVTKLSPASLLTDPNFYKPADRIDANGFAHILAYADAAAYVADPTVAPTLSMPGTGSSLAAGTYYVRYSWVTATGETKPSPEAAITIAANQKITAVIPALPIGATSANIYISKGDVINFAGKVSGSVVENPNKANRSNFSAATLLAPSNTAFLTEPSSVSYGQISTLDGTVYPVSDTVNGQMVQQIFSFDLIKWAERKLGYSIGATTADKVAWLKANVTGITCNWYGYGTGPSGNKAYLTRWVTDTAAWSPSPVSHTASVVTKLAFTLGAIANGIDTNGFCHFLAYADASNGTTASTINTDYVELVPTLATDHSITTNFVGKVAGSTTVNGNKALKVSSTTLNAPTTYTEVSQTGYNNLATNSDGLLDGQSTSVSGEIAGRVFSFDLIKLAEAKLGRSIGADTAAKIAWLKSNLSAITFNVYANGSGPSGNRATLAPWNALSAGWALNWTTTTSASIVKLSVAILSTNNLTSYIDANGFANLLIYADASNGTVASVINTDYAEAVINFQMDAAQITNFNGKVSGSTVENPHIAKRTSSAGAPSLLFPSDGSWTEMNASNLSALVALDTNSTNLSTTTNGGISQHIFSFNLIEMTERKFGMSIGADTASKVAWLKANLSSIQCNWYGYGSGPLGNKATLGAWSASAGGWQGIGSHTNSAPTKIQSTYTVGNGWVNSGIDSSGFAHWVAWADASNGTTASAINTDFVECLLTYQPLDGSETLQTSVTGTSYTQTAALVAGTVPKAASTAIVSSVINTDYVELVLSYSFLQSSSAFEEKKDYTVGVTFSGILGIPTNIADVQTAIRDMLPAHLAVNFMYRYLTWQNLIDANLTWTAFEGKGYTFKSLETAKLP